MGHSKHTTPHQILEFFERELDRIERDRLLSHCEKCESCKQELYRQFWALVLEKGPDSVSFKPEFVYGDCFSPEMLVAYTEGQLQPDEKRLVEEHLSHCRICQTELEVETSEWPD